MSTSHQELFEDSIDNSMYKKANTLEAKKKELIEQLVADDL